MKLNSVEFKHFIDNYNTALASLGPNEARDLRENTYINRIKYIIEYRGDNVDLARCYFSSAYIKKKWRNKYE